MIVSVSTFEQIEVLVVYSTPFPLTPALSLGEREKDPRRRAMLGAQEIVARESSDPLSRGGHAHLVKTRTGDTPAFSLSPRGTSGERVGERGCRFVGLNHAHEPNVTPLPGPRPIRSSWGEGEEIFVPVGHVFLTASRRYSRLPTCATSAFPSLCSLRSFVATFPVLPLRPLCEVAPSFCPGVKGGV